MKTFILICVLLGVVSCGKKSSSSDHRERHQDEVSDETFEEEYVKHLNNYRDSLGLRKLKYVKVIETSATEHSAYMASGIGRFGHWGWKNRCNRLMNELQGINCREIVAMGQKTPLDVLNAWIKSPSHRRAIEDRRATHTGIGVRKNKDGIHFWTQIFIEQR